MKLSYSLLLSAIFGCEAWSNSPSPRKTFSSLKSSLNDSNVVLRPSENPEAFDSQKIGAARVHRYARDAGDSEAEFIM
jgi:hypothetical protein